MSGLADRYRREGLADAVVILVARRIHPQTTAEDWGRALGLQQHEVRAAIDRFRERHTIPTAPLRSLPGQHGNRGRKIPSLAERRERDATILRLRAEGESLPMIAAAVGLTASRVSQILSRTG